MESMPPDIIGNGDNLWEWAATFSREVHRRDKITVLTRQIVKRSCGDCRYWMTKTCPRELPGGLSGYSRGPSCEGIPCSLYVEKTHYAAMRAERVAELEALRNVE